MTLTWKKRKLNPLAGGEYRAANYRILKYRKAHEGSTGWVVQVHDHHGVYQHISKALPTLKAAKAFAQDDLGVVIK